MPKTVARFSHLNLQLVEPAALLRPFIKHYWFIATDGAASHTEYLPSDTGCGLLFNLSGSLILGNEDGNATQARPLAPPIILSGPHTRFLPVTTGPYCDAAGIRFQPGMAYPFFQTTLAEFVTPTAAPEALCQRLHLTQVFDQLVAIKDVTARSEFLNHWLLDQLQKALNVNPELPHALNQLEQQTLPSITSLAETTQLSQRQLERVFKEWVGISPKQYSRLLRINSARHQLKSSKSDTDLSEVALAAGYFDQAHFNREFKRVVGLTPGQYLKKCRTDNQS